MRRRENLRGLVGVPGIEPGTSSLSGTRSNQLSYTPASGPHRKDGGGSRVRTGGIQLAKLALYQLSYAPGAGRLSRRALKRPRGPPCGGPEGMRGMTEPVPAFTIAGALRRGCSLERR